MKKISVKLSIKYLWMMVIVLIINEPPLFYRYPIINIVYKSLQLFLIVYMCINAYINKFYNTPTILVTLFSIWNVIVTLIFNPTEVFEITYRYLYLLLHVFCVSHYAQNEESFYTKILAKVLGWYSIINCIMYVIRPDGWIYTVSGKVAQNWYFLGLDNQFARIMLPGLILLLINPKRTFKEWLFLGLVIFSDAYVLLQRMTGMLVFCFALTILLWMILHFIEVSSQIYAISYCVIFGIVVIFQNMNLGFLNKIIVEVLGKDLTFSGRTNIWREAFSLISKNFLMGYGSTSSRNLVFGISAHNIILQTILESGIIGVCILILIIHKCLFVNRQNNYSIANLVMGSFIIMLSLMFEVYSLEYFFVILILLFKCKLSCCKKIDCSIGDYNE